MINIEYQELHRQYTVCVNESEKNNLLEKIRNNIKWRNSNNANYVMTLVEDGKIINIDTADYSALIEINGDMNASGK